MVTNEFKNIINEDIERCCNEIKHGNKTSRGILHGTLISKYAKIVDGFDENLQTLFYDNDGSCVKENLETMKQKLELFKAMEYKNSYTNDYENNSVTINNTNNMEVTLNISFSETKEQIENMTSLKEEEIQEILFKINELESIVNSTDRKTKKWESANNIIKWIADKSFDVGITLLPLILKL